MFFEKRVVPRDSPLSNRLNDDWETITSANPITEIFKYRYEDILKFLLQSSTQSAFIRSNKAIKEEIETLKEDFLSKPLKESFINLRKIRSLLIEEILYHLDIAIITISLFFNDGILTKFLTKDEHINLTKALK